MGNSKCTGVAKCPVLESEPLGALGSCFRRSTEKGTAGAHHAVQPGYAASHSGLFFSIHAAQAPFARSRTRPI